MDRTNDMDKTIDMDMTNDMDSNNQLYRTDQLDWTNQSDCMSDKKWEEMDFPSIKKDFFLHECFIFGIFSGAS